MTNNKSKVANKDQLDQGRYHKMVVTNTITYFQMGLVYDNTDNYNNRNISTVHNLDNNKIKTG